MKVYWRWGLVVGLLGVAACSGTGGPSANLEITSAALELQGIQEAVYTITVENGLGETVWGKTVDSMQYGDDRASLTYVGPCDADANPNFVTLSLDGLVADDGHSLSADEWTQPPSVRREVTCLENADVLVEFNLSVMRAAQQGFFDIAVNFEDIFCSAKLDCQPALLHNPETDKRELTAVVAFACTAGPNQDTTLYWGSPRITCDDGRRVYPINPGAGEGNQGPIYSDPRDPKSNGVYQWANYRTQEQFEDLDKCAWVTSIGIDPRKIGDNCYFEASATASDAPFKSPFMHTPDNTVYPVINYKVPLTGRGGEVLCKTNPLNGRDSGVTTQYTKPEGAQFQIGAACGGEPFFNTIECTGVADGEPTVVVRAYDPATDPAVPTSPIMGGGAPPALVMVSYNGQTIGPLTLPNDAVIDMNNDECCVEPCCEEGN